MAKKIFFLSFFLPWMLLLQGNDFIVQVKKMVKEHLPQAIKIRRHLHQIPEICYQERKTSAFICDYLKKWGLEVQEGIAGTGIKAILRGKHGQPVIGIRSDMDALPITEKTGLPFQSKHAGRMHACGHDGHMTNVLITAKILSQLADEIPGTIVFIFQPCEEGGSKSNPSGAGRMVLEGVLENPKIEAMLGHHIMPEFPVGTVALRPGPIMANVCSIYITIRGKSSHGAFPHQGIDAIWAASTAIIQFQSLISRFKNPNEPGVLSIGTINGGVGYNVIAEEVKLTGTARTFSFTLEDKIHQGMKNILKGLQQSCGITYELTFNKASRFVKNDPCMTRSLTPVLKQLLGEKNVIETEPFTVGEDFSVYSHKVPSLLFFLGTGGEAKLHSPQYSIDEKIFMYGPLIFSVTAVELLKML